MKEDRNPQPWHKGRAHRGSAAGPGLGTQWEGVKGSGERRTQPGLMEIPAPKSSGTVLDGAGLCSGEAVPDETVTGEAVLGEVVQGGAVPGEAV